MWNSVIFPGSILSDQINNCFQYFNSPFLHTQVYGNVHTFCDAINFLYVNGHWLMLRKVKGDCCWFSGARGLLPKIKTRSRNSAILWSKTVGEYETYKNIKSEPQASTLLQQYWRCHQISWNLLKGFSLIRTPKDRSGTHHFFTLFHWHIPAHSICSRGMLGLLIWSGLRLRLLVEPAQTAKIRIHRIPQIKEKPFTFDLQAQAINLRLYTKHRSLLSTLITCVSWSYRDKVLVSYDPWLLCGCDFCVAKN